MNTTPYDKCQPKTITQPFLMKTLHSKIGQPMLVNWFYGGGLRESPFYGSRGTDFVIPLPVSEGIPGVQLVGIEYCGWAMKDM